MKLAESNFFIDDKAQKFIKCNGAARKNIGGGAKMTSHIMTSYYQRPAAQLWYLVAGAGGKSTLLFKIMRPLHFLIFDIHEKLSAFFNLQTRTCYILLNAEF